MTKNSGDKIWATRDQNSAPSPDSSILAPPQLISLFIYCENFQTALYLESSMNSSLKYSLLLPEIWEFTPDYEVLFLGNKTQKKFFLPFFYKELWSEWIVGHSIRIQFINFLAIFNNLWIT